MRKITLLNFFSIGLKRSEKLSVKSLLTYKTNENKKLSLDVA